MGAATSGREMTGRTHDEGEKREEIDVSRYVISVLIKIIRMIAVG
jgi:hypothetical protein